MCQAENVDISSRGIRLCVVLASTAVNFCVSASVSNFLLPQLFSRTSSRAKTIRVIGRHASVSSGHINSATSAIGALRNRGQEVNHRVLYSVLLCVP